MWPFKKKKSQADRALSVMDRAIEDVESNWRGFSSQLAFKEGVTINEQIAMFSVPMMQGLRNRFPDLNGSPDEVLFVFIIQGVERSGTFPKGVVLEAFGLEGLET